MFVLASQGFNSPADDSLIYAVRQAFENAGFDETRVLAALDCASFPTFRQRRRALADFLRHTADDTERSTFVRLFVLDEPVPVNRFREAAHPASIEDWERIGLVSVEQDEIRATTEICPVGALLLVCDWNRENAPADSVMSPSASTRALEQMMIRRCSDHTLDLGTGCGILALSAAGHSETVLATDINERAVKYASFNAKFNRIENVRFSCGGMFQPVEKEKFDLIICNPPFLVGPKIRFLHSSTDLASDHFSEQIVRTAPAFLNEGGYFQMVCNWAEVDSQTGEDRVTQWFEKSECDAWVLHSHAESAVDYARARSREMFENEGEATSLYEEWLQYFAQAKIRGIHFGVITMRRRSGEANWMRYDQMPAVAGPCGDSIEQGFRSRDFLDEHSRDDELLDGRLKCADLVINWNKQGDMAAVSLRSGLKFAANLDRAIIEFIRSCKGNVTLRDQLRRIAADSRQPISQFTPKFITTVRRLVEIGILHPADEP